MEQVLKNIKILITRSLDDSKDIFEFLEMAGAEVVPFPAIKISPTENFNRFDLEVENLAKFEYLIFTSGNACRVFSNRIKELGIAPDYSNTIVVATGSKTAEVCREYGIQPNLVPEEFSAEGVTNILSEIDLTDKKVFIPSSELARTELKESLSALGASVLQLPIYRVTTTPRTELDEQISSITKTKPDLFSFTSPSNFKNFLTIMGIDNPSDYFEESVVAAIGKTTKNAIKEFNVNVDLVPDSFTIDAMAEAIIEKYT